MRRHERHRRQGAEDPVPPRRHDARGAGARPVRARTAGRATGCAPDRWVTWSATSSRWNKSTSATPSACPATRPHAAARLPASRSGWSTAGCTRPRGRTSSELRDALSKLSINDPSFEFEPETSEALGFGFRCGFLGLLHMEIIQQRLEQESDVDLVQTAPNVTYQIVDRKGEVLEIHRPQEVPDAGRDRGVSPADRAGQSALPRPSTSAP